MAMIWQVRDLLRMLQRDFEPNQLIAFSIMSEDDVARRLGVSGSLLEAIMLNLMRMVDQGEPVLVQYLEAAQEQALDSIAPIVEKKCVCCHSDVRVSLPVYGSLGSVDHLWYCASCCEESGLFVDATPLDVFHGRASGVTMTPNFRNYLRRKDMAVTWLEFEKELKR